MHPQQVEMFLMANGSKFPPEQIMYIRQQLMMLDEQRAASLPMLTFKDPTTALILSIFLGGYGIDRFYIGDTGLGLGKLFTCGGLGIWAIIDWFNIQSATRDKNFEKLMSLFGGYPTM